MSNMTRVRLVTDVVRGATTFRAGTICDVVPGRVNDDGPKLLVNVDGQLVALAANQYEKIMEADTIVAFFRDIEEVCRRHNISIGHEDGHGRFLILDHDDARGSFGEDVCYDKRKKVR